MDGYDLPAQFQSITNDDAYQDAQLTDINNDVNNHLADTANPHATDIENLGSGTLAELNDAITDADLVSEATFNNHSARHENGGADEISVAGLSGELADNQPPKAHVSTHLGGGSDSLYSVLDHAPTANEDVNDGYLVGSRWINTTDGYEYVCTDNSAGAANWSNLSQGGGGDDADAIHDNEASEISAITRKASAVGTDLLIIEDSADGYNKKKLHVEDLGHPIAPPDTHYVSASFTQNLSLRQYTTLQAAFNNMASGDIVYLFPGTYHEALTPQVADITIIGQHKDLVEISNAAGSGTAAFLTLSSGETVRMKNVSFVGSVDVNSNSAAIYMEECYSDSGQIDVVSGDANTLVDLYNTTIIGPGAQRYAIWIRDVDPSITIKYCYLKGSAGAGNRQAIYFGVANNNVDMGYSKLIDSNGNGGLLAAGGVNPTISSHHNVYDAAYPGGFTNDIANPQDVFDAQGDF
jgi:hypothetical protein